jgi:tRNA(fMet)-specific endonuclease VapC
MQQCDAAQIGLCSVVKAELIYGARKSERVEENLKLLAEFFAPFSCFPFDDQCAEYYGTIRADLERAGQPIGPNDLMIAAIARVHDHVLVTHNTGEFSRVVGLRIEDWELDEGVGHRRRWSGRGAFAHALGRPL